MDQPKRIVVMDSSALLATLQNFTDPHQPSLEVLEHMMAPNANGERHIDHILIPDHIFYELTGILPISLKFMHAKFAAARGNHKELESLIEMYAQASPRGDKNDVGGKIKNHVRALLHFVAHHPESLVDTEVGEQYCKRLKSDYAMLCAHSGSDLTHYRPTFADAFHHLGDDFKASDLRVHIGQLMMIGLITEREYGTQMGLEEKEGGQKKRFFLLKEMLDRLGGTKLKDPELKTPPEPEEVAATGHESGLLTKHARDAIDKQETKRYQDEHEHGKKTKTKGTGKNYITLGFFERYPKILEASLTDHRQKKRKPIKQRHIEHSKSSSLLLHEAVGPSPLLIEHYCYGGVIPKNNPALLAIAKTLGIETQGLDTHDAKHDIRKALHDRGFFEISPTLGQLREIQQALKQATIDAPMLDQFIQGVSRQPEVLRSKFNDACKPNGTIEKDLPYEKVFTHALINRTLGMGNPKLAWDHFVTLLEQSHSMHDNQGMLSSANGDALIDPQAGILYLDTHGIEGRSGTHSLGYVTAPLEHRMVDGTIRSYYKISSDALIHRAWRELTQPANFPKRVGPIFEALLAPAVKQDASSVRETARAILGEDQLLQMEKDFANRYARKHLTNAPPYRSIIAALHTTSRITRKNLGEVATLEVAQNASEQHPESPVWLINHDSDLFPNAATGKPQLEASIARQHAGLIPKLGQLNARSLGNKNLHFVNTTQFLSSISTLLGHDPKHVGQWVHQSSVGDGRKPPYQVFDKPIVRRVSTSWESQVQASINAGVKDDRTQRILP